jgi:hypothetical protein
VPVNANIISRCEQVEGENSVYEFNSLRFHQVCIIGVIRSVIKKANDITYMIDDMTCDTEVNVKLPLDVKTKTILKSTKLSSNHKT